MKIHFFYYTSLSQLREHRKCATLTLLEYTLRELGREEHTMCALSPNACPGTNTPVATPLQRDNYNRWVARVRDCTRSSPQSISGERSWRLNDERHTVATDIDTITRPDDGCAACLPHGQTYASPYGEHARRYPAKGRTLALPKRDTRLCCRMSRWTSRRLHR